MFSRFSAGGLWAVPLCLSTMLSYHTLECMSTGFRKKAGKKIASLYSNIAFLGEHRKNVGI